MYAIILVEILAVIIIAYTVFFIRKNHKIQQENAPQNLNFLQIFYRAGLVFIATIIAGSLLLDVAVHIFYPNPGQSDGFSDKLMNFLGTWAVFGMYSFLFSVIPAIIVLIPGLFFSLNSKVLASKKIGLNFALGLFVSVVVISINIFTFSWELVLYQIPFLITGIVSCMLVPKYFGDYKV